MSANSACPKCKHVTDELSQKITKCNACDGFWHIACANITAKMFETVKKLNGYLWFCDKCIGENILAELKDFRDFRTQHAKLSKEMAAHEARLQSIEQKLENALQVQQQVNPTTITKEDVALILHDELEAEKRKNNLCVFGLPDSVTVDKTTFVQLCCNQLELPIADVQQNIQTVRRVGTSDLDASSRPRPLIVQTSSTLFRNRVLKNASKLKSYRPTGSTLKVFIARDLTKKQQAENKLLQDELSRRREQGENVVIYRGRIIPRTTPSRQNRLSTELGSTQRDNSQLAAATTFHHFQANPDNSNAGNSTDGTLQLPASTPLQEQHQTGATASATTSAGHETLYLTPTSPQQDRVLRSRP